MPSPRRSHSPHAPRPTRISKTLRHAVWTTDDRQYRLAQAILVHPSTLSGWLNGIFPVQQGDPRVIQLGALVGVPASACFEPEPSQAIAIGQDADPSERQAGATARRARDAAPVLKGECDQPAVDSRRRRGEGQPLSHGRRSL